MKKRIKRALAAFLKDELLEFIGYGIENKFMPLSNVYSVQNIDTDIYKMEQVIPLRDTLNSTHIHNSDVVFEDRLNECKEAFCNELMNHIYVEDNSLVNSEFTYDRHIRLSIRFQKPRA